MICEGSGKDRDVDGRGVSVPVDGMMLGPEIEPRPKRGRLNETPVTDQHGSAGIFQPLGFMSFIDKRPEIQIS